MHPLYPRKFPVPCPRCGSEGGTDYHRQKPHRRFPEDLVLTCMMCGYICYGDEVVRLITEERVRWDMKQAVKRAWERAQVKPEAERIDNVIILPLCAWEDCEKGPQGGPAMTRRNSKYCSRDCSNKNARWRFAQRRKEEK